MGTAIQDSDGVALRLVSVGLDAGDADRASQAARQAHVSSIAAFGDYPDALHNGKLEDLFTATEALLCMIDFDKDRELAVQTAARIHVQSMTHATLIAVSAEENPDLILQAMRAGCTEYITKPLRLEPLTELLRKLKDRWAATAQRSIQPAGRVLAFMGVRGGAGATTIAVHLASFLARQGQKTLIVDQHPCLGHVALLFGMDEHRLNFYELLQNMSRLDLMLLQSYVAHHSSGVDVLASPDGLSQHSGIEAAALGTAIRFVAGIYRFVLLDCQAGPEELNLVTATGCDELCLVATPDVPALRDLARYLERLRELRLPSEKLKVVINQYGSGRSVTIAQIEKAIDHPVALSLPVEAEGLARALDTGQPISPEQRSEFGSRIRKWAAELAPSTIAPVPTRRRFAFWS